MTISLIGANIVLLAKNHNPSIVSRDWLSQRGILTDSIKSFTHTPALSVVETERFSFFVDPDRLQLGIKKNFIKEANSLCEKILSYVRYLPETPYEAVGFNFGYELEHKTSILQKIYCPGDKLESLFSENFQLGGIIKYEFSGFTVKLIIQPDINEKIKADFNFHYGLNDNSDIENIIKMHGEAMAESRRVLEELVNE